MAKRKAEKITVPSEVKPSTKTLPGIRFYSLIILFFSFALYFNTLFNDYNLDDELVTKNHRITSQGWDAVKLNFDVFADKKFEDSTFSCKLKYFFPMVLRVPYYEDKAGYRYEYRPMVFATFAIEHAIFAKKEFVQGNYVYIDNPHWSHLFNVLLYCACCLLLFSVLLKLLRNYNIIFPFIITCLFAAHPIHTEVVASIKNRDEILALIFGLLSLDFAIRYVRGKKIYRLLPIMLFFVLALLSKTTAITFALLVPLSLIMLTAASYFDIVIITILLLIPTAVYSRLYTVADQLGLSVLLLAAVHVFWVLKNIMGTGKVKNYVVLAKGMFDGGSDNSDETVGVLNFGKLKNPLSISLIVLAVLCCLGTSASGIYMGRLWMAVIPFSVLALTYLFGSAELKAVLITPIVLLGSLAVLKFPGPSTGFEGALMIFLALQLLSKNKVIRILGIVNFVVYAFITLIALQSPNFAVLLIFFACFHYKFLFKPGRLLLLPPAFAVLKSLYEVLFQSNSFIHLDIMSLLLIAGFAMIRQHREKLLGKIMMGSMPVFFVLYMLVLPVSKNDTVTKVVTQNFSKLNAVRAADPMPVQQSRPLKFVEYPLELNSPLSVKTGTAMLVLGKYLKMVFVPFPMSYYYGFAYVTPEKLTDIVPLFASIIYLILLAVAIYFFNKQTLLSFSILFYLISISVFTNLIIPIPGMMGDRFLLIPSIGFCIALVYLLSLFFKEDFSTPKLELKTMGKNMKASLGVIVSIYSLLTVLRNFDWKDQLTLFRHDIDAVQNSAQAQNLLAIHLFSAAKSESTPPADRQQLAEEAIVHFKKTLEIYPQFFNASFDLGRTYEFLKRYDEAYEAYSRTVALDTTFITPYLSMGSIQHAKRNYELAEQFYLKYLKTYPSSAQAYLNLAYVYFGLNQFDKSIEISKHVIELGPNVFEAHGAFVNMGKAFMRKEEPDSTLYYFELAYRLNPNDQQLNMVIEDLKNKKNARLPLKLPG